MFRYKPVHSPYYDDVQTFLSQCFSAGIKPNLDAIQSAVYQQNYIEGNKKQLMTVYRDVDAGRKEGVNRWNELCGGENDEEFFGKLTDMEENHPELIQSEYSDDAFGTYDHSLRRGDFGEDTKNLIENQDTIYVVVAAVFKNEIQLLSKQEKINFTIPLSGAKKAVWVLPSWWRWAIRERSEFKKSFKRIGTQFGRSPLNPIAQPRLESGIPIGVIQRLTSNTAKLLEYDVNAWKCPKCGRMNTSQDGYCGDCGFHKLMI